MSEKEEKIKHLERVQKKIRYLTVGQAKTNELAELIYSEIRNEHGNKISSPLYVKDLNNTKRKLGIDSFKESKYNFERDINEEIDRLKFR